LHPLVLGERDVFTDDEAVTIDRKVVPPRVVLAGPEPMHSTHATLRPSVLAIEMPVIGKMAMSS
jgi:hypothetical protein